MSKNQQRKPQHKENAFVDEEWKQNNQNHANLSPIQVHQRIESQSNTLNASAASTEILGNEVIVSGVDLQGIDQEEADKYEDIKLEDDMVIKAYDDVASSNGNDDIFQVADAAEVTTAGNQETYRRYSDEFESSDDLSDVGVTTGETGW